jgi:hypothetical protein
MESWRSFSMTPVSSSFCKLERITRMLCQILIWNLKVFEFQDWDMIISCNSKLFLLERLYIMRVCKRRAETPEGCTDNWKHVSKLARQWQIQYVVTEILRLVARKSPVTGCYSGRHHFLASDLMTKTRNMTRGSLPLQKKFHNRNMHTADKLYQPQPSELAVFGVYPRLPSCI